MPYTLLLARLTLQACTARLFTHGRTPQFLHPLRRTQPNRAGVIARDAHPGVIKKTSGAERPFLLPTDASQIGDVIIYLCWKKGKVGWERVAYHRMSAAEAMAHGYGFTRKWLVLRPIMPQLTKKKSLPPPAICYSLL